MDKIFIFLQHVVPQHLLSRVTGWLAELEHPAWLKNWVIGAFIKQFKVDMSEAAEPDHERYPNFNAFFTRELVEGARPIAAADVVCPADGAISQLGDIVDGRIFQAKGQDYSAFELLGGDAEWAARFAGGKFATIYLSPRDYHRVHMPLGGRLLATTYVPGDLFSVNGVTAENVDRLFARNERLVCYFETGFGPVAMILVGAMVVAGIETVWGGQIAPPPKTTRSERFDNTVAPVELARGEEMGRFKLGSTVILLFPQDTVEWDQAFSAGTSTTLGQPLASAID
ncbi:phosphatidylserine decarboxylase [Halioglobus maricola]|uniref:Phosphatidylserine decarboxylase proenzyme n=1 Tax=Halioglobus maricola TaxID=2601894 RepID=A0A5P9NFJ8_9GAMM|nr:archaetidylserine decarboxylase [Halioglobus maricola]QFU74567.1 phosphatidylserine decarboxylase [Halioglobus maricola]